MTNVETDAEGGDKRCARPVAITPAAPAAFIAAWPIHADVLANFLC